MVRVTLIALSVSGFLAVSQEAQAQDFGPYMWGAGPKLGTIIIPGRYPYAFPGSVAKYDFIDSGPQAGADDGENKGRDLDEDGKPRFSTLSGTGFDLRLGGEGFFGINRDNRVGAGVGFGAGKRYFDTWITLNYDRRLWGDNPFDLLAGAQIGYGYARWGGDSTLPGGENESYRMTYFPVRARLTGQFRNKTQMYGLGLFAGTAVPGNTTYTDLDGNVQETVGGPGNFALHLQAGLEIDVQFGDFTPPKAKDGKGGRGGGKNGKGGKGDGGKAGKGDGGKNGKGDGGKAGKNGKGGKSGKGGKGGRFGATEAAPSEVAESGLSGMGTRSGLLLLPSAGAGLLLGFQALRRRRQS